MFSRPATFAAVAICALIGLSAEVQAAPITGTINLAGDFQPLQSGIATQNLEKATGIDVLPAGGGSGAFRTLGGTGTLASFANSAGGTIKDFSFAPFAALNTFYTITVGGGTLSFDLLNLTVEFQSANSITLLGSGTLHQTGFDNTVGTFNFSGQSTNGASPQATFSWSAGSQAANVPEPMSIALLGAGLAGIGIARRRRG